MTKPNRDQFSAHLGVEPVLLDSCHFSGCRRPRLFWIDWPIEARGEETLQQLDGYKEWTIPGCFQDNWWVDQGCERRGSGPLPTLTRALPRRSPPKQPAGLATASREAIERWTTDNYRFQVYQYEQQHLLYRADGSWRLPSLMEREKVMGFPLGYISNGLNPKLTMDAIFNLGASMIGNSFNVYAMTFLLDELLSFRSPMRSPRSLGSMLSRCETAPAGWAHHEKFSPSSQPDERSRMLVHEFLRVGDRAGSDVKLDLGIPFRARAWPRAGIRAHLFNWRVVHGYAWKHAAHINVLEMQAVVNGLRWRLRKLTHFRHRVLHLVDNQVVASVIAKGRSSSFRLRKSISKLTSLCVAGGLQLSVGYVATHDNPSDLPSRWADRPRRKWKLVDKSAKRHVKESA